MLDRKDLVRIIVIVSFVAVAVVLILWKYFSLMVLNRPNALPTAVTTPVERGPILDRNGRILAVETRQYSVSAWIPNVRDKSADAQQLAAVLHRPESDIKDELDSHTGFVYIQRKIPKNESDQIRSLVEAGRITGIYLDPDYARVYPNGDLGGHILGFVGTDNSGLAGIEYAYNSVLLPHAGNGPPGTEQFGDQVFLTIDSDVQYEAEKLAGQIYAETNPDAVILLVMQAKTGDMLAYVSYPEFDPNTFAKYPPSVRQDFPVSYIYEPGSVIKIFTISSFLQLGGITPETRFYDDGTYVHTLPNGQVIRIKGLAPHEWEDAQLIIKWSSNVGAAYASDSVSDSAFYSMLHKFGFGQPTFVGLPGEERGILRPISEWTPRSKPTISFGQEIGVTAMQIAAAATVLTNGGVLLKPHVVSKIVAPDGSVIRSFPREPIRQVISPQVAQEMLGYMETGTEPGVWAAAAKIPGVLTSAKTGTSQIYDPATGGYSPTAYVASCISIFPTNDPQYIVYGVIVNPRNKSYFGSTLAAPLVGKVGEYLVSHYDVPTSNDVSATAAPVTQEAPSSLVVGATMPDLSGMSERQLLPLLKDPRLKVHIQGNGWVASQNPAAGTPITQGMEVTIALQ
ncbi:MAG TPA: penicillin-binding protein [Spirochaetia bacterium]|nr:penicillin-binding protein [Spirochaetia bacterium]